MDALNGGTLSNVLSPRTVFFVCSLVRNHLSKNKRECYYDISIEGYAARLRHPKKDSYRKTCYRNHVIIKKCRQRNSCYILCTQSLQETLPKGNLLQLQNSKKGTLQSAKQKQFRRGTVCRLALGTLWYEVCHKTSSVLSLQLT